jgi:hypothetical protein
MSTTPTSPPQDTVTRPVSRPNPFLVLLRGIGGAILGGIAGYFLFRLLSSRGMFGYAIPGALLGFGAGLTARGRSEPLAILCAVAALCLTVYAEWASAPFVKDGSLSFFVTHLHKLPNLNVKMLITAVGVACAYWLAKGR